MQLPITQKVEKGHACSLPVERVLWRICGCTILSLFVILSNARSEEKLTLTLAKKITHQKLSWPKSVRCSPDGRYVYVNNLEGKNTMILDASTYEILKIIEHEGKPVECDFTQNGRYVWISYLRLTGHSDRERSVVVVYDTEVGRIIKKVQVGIMPKMVATSPDGRYVFVSNWRSNSVSVISTSSYEVVKEIKVGIIPRGICFTPDAQYCYVANMGGWTISVIDMESLEVIETITDGVGNRPRHLVITRDGEYIYISNHGDGNIRRLNTSSDEITHHAKVGIQPRTIVLSSDDKYIFCVNYKSNTVSVVDTEKMKQIYTVSTGFKPVGIDISPDGRKLWVSNYASGSIYVYDIDYGEPPLSIDK